MSIYPPIKTAQTDITVIESNAKNLLNTANILLNRSYLGSLNQLSALPFDKESAPLSLSGDIRIFRIERIAQENKQSVLESTTAIYTALGTAGYSVFIMLKSNGFTTDVFIGTRGAHGKILGQNAGELLQETFKGHFPGSKLINLNANHVHALLDEALNHKNIPYSTLTSVTGVPSLATEDKNSFMQGLEHFIDAAEGRTYQAIILAEPVTTQDLDQIRTGYEQISTKLSALEKRQYTFGSQESDTVGLSISKGIDESFSKSLGMTMSYGNSLTKGITESSSNSLGVGIFAGVGVGVGGGNLSINRNHSHGSSESTGKTESKSHSSTDTHSRSTSLSDTKSLNKTQSDNQQISLEIKDKNIENLLAKIDDHFERINEARTYGGWQSAAYFISDSKASSESLASIFLGLMRGIRSSTEDFALNTWSGQNKDPILQWLSALTHPRLAPTIHPDPNLSWITPATLVSGKEMAIQLSLPRRSTSTVSVIQTTSFGRKIHYLDDTRSIDRPNNKRTINLGTVRHVWNDLKAPVSLDIDQLTSHLFITGSTGSGKSNTVYTILKQLLKHDVHFLVIEPAKGEYKQVFGSQDNVTVLGTNTKYTQLLKINPFSFPSGTHVFEHVDRLVEVFSMCWPMYAAMPAILKEAIIQAYVVCGWDLVSSENAYTPALFPTFSDLLEQLRLVIELSDWSQEVKNNYTGSLITRVKSLTNGLNGQIFCSNETDHTTLFDSNTIVDLSRIGSQETKSLIAAVLIIRLNEYRSATSGVNQPLKHITVLEEAHHLLKRNSSSQANEGADIAGKAVEMLANAIAEMRTWGEGFIIADQSPSTVDLAAIRNTNTKIIMRLPDETDRRIAGKSSALNEEQIDELAKLPCGVAVVYQNDWLEPILCRVSKFSTDAHPWQYTKIIKNDAEEQKSWTALLTWLLQKRLPHTELSKEVQLEEILNTLQLSTRKKILINSLMTEFNQTGKLPLQNEVQFLPLATTIIDLLDIRQDILCTVNNCSNFEMLNIQLNALITKRTKINAPDLLLQLQHCIMKDLSNISDNWLKIYAQWYHSKEITA